jgi:hypothetical protein
MRGRARGCCGRAASVWSCWSATGPILPRAALLFRLAGLRVAGWAAVPPPSILWEIDAVVRECVALPRSLVRGPRVDH